MGNIEFNPASERQLCQFDTKVFTSQYPELATIVWSSLFSLLCDLFLILFVLRAKSKAMQTADSSAAAAVILPSYLPILYLGFGSALTHIFVVCGYAVLCDSAYLDEKPWLSGLNPMNSMLYAIYVLSYDWFTATIAVLFFLRSVSRQSFVKAFICGLILGLCSAVPSGFAVNYVEFGGSIQRGFEYLLMICSQTVHLILLISLACRPGRRKSSNPFLFHALLWRLACVASHVYSLTRGPMSMSLPAPDWVVFVIEVVRTALLPPIVYWTLLLDTWYWRGVPRRKRLNERAIRVAAESLRAGSSSDGQLFSHPEAAGGIGRWLAQPRYPPRDHANDQLQQLLDDASDLVIDHAFLSIDYETLLGRGASASVFHGRLTLLWGGGRFLPGLFSVSGSALNAADPNETRARSVEVAVKIYTPPELDEEAILAIREETDAWGELSKLACRTSVTGVEGDQEQQPAVFQSQSDDDADLIVLNSRPANLVRFFGICVMPPHLSLVFEYCEGGALSDWIEQASPSVTLDVRMSIVKDCALAVYFLHSHGFIHRDLKAANFLLKHGTALLTDFGTCISANSDQEQTFFCSRNFSTSELKNATMRGTTVGTVDHMAPELLQEDYSGGRIYSNASDIYALGITVASVIAFRAPFPGLREWDVRQRVIKGERPFNLQQDAIFQQDITVRDWIQKAFAWNPINRPSALELVQIFESR